MNDNVSAIFALRSAPDPEELKDEFENIREKIKSKPLPFLSGKGKKKKKENDQVSIPQTYFCLTDPLI